MESRALVVILALLPGRKKYAAEKKTAALSLLVDLVSQGCSSRGADQVLGGTFSFNMFSAADGGFRSMTLSWTAEGMTVAGLLDVFWLA